MPLNSYVASAPESLAVLDEAATGSTKTLVGRAIRDTCDLDTATDDYAGRFAGKIGRYLLSVQHAATRRMLRSYERAKVLDLGGGHGQNAELLADMGHRVTVYGSDAGCDHHIKGLVASDRVDFEVGDLYELPYDDREQDVVISYRMLAHVQDPNAYIAEMCRVAGKAVVIDFSSVCSINAIAPLLFAQKQKFEKNTRPFAMFTPYDINRRFAKHGFKRADHVGQFVWPMVLHRALKKPLISKMLEFLPQALGVGKLMGSPLIARYERVI